MELARVVVLDPIGRSGGRPDGARGSGRELTQVLFKTLTIQEKHHEATCIEL